MRYHKQVYSSVKNTKTLTETELERPDTDPDQALSRGIAPSEDEVSLLDLAIVLVRHRRRILGATLVTILIALLLALRIRRSFIGIHAASRYFVHARSEPPSGSERRTCGRRGRLPGPGPRSAAGPVRRKRRAVATSLRSRPAGSRRRPVQAPGYRFP